jgi:hypothetical protein
MIGRAVFHEHLPVLPIDAGAEETTENVVRRFDGLPDDALPSGHQ